MRKFILLVVIFTLTGELLGQINNELDRKSRSFFSPEYTIHSTAGDLSDRFGTCHSVGLRFGIKTERNLFLGVGGNYTFGRNVNWEEEGVLSNLTNAQGEIIANEGAPATVLIQQRGFNFSLEGGKYFKFKSAKNESGLVASVGLGFVQHNIRFETQLDEVPQLEGDYEKGYDRLTNGLLLTQNVGWLFFSQRRLGDFYIGAQLMEGFTASRREINFDTGLSEKSQTRLDIWYGLKVGWVVPFYKRTSY